MQRHFRLCAQILTMGVISEVSLKSELIMVGKLLTLESLSVMINKKL